MTASLLTILKLCVPAMVFAVGLGTNSSDLMTLPRRPWLLLRSLLAMYVVVPLLALAAAWLLPLSTGVKIALLVLAISAGAPLLPRKVMGIAAICRCWRGRHPAAPQGTAPNREAPAAVMGPGMHMANRVMRRMVLTTLCAVPAPAVAQEQAQQPDHWTVTVAPYLWAARLDGDAKIAGIKADVDVSFKDTLENLDIAGMALIEARKGRLGFAVNPLFVRTESNARSGPLEADNTTDIATMGAALLYRAVDWEFNQTSSGEPQTLAIEPLVGARLNYLRGEIETKLDAAGLQASRQFDESQTWVDPLIGVNAILRLSEHWGVRAEADIGGFGVGSELTWNAQAVLTYGFTLAGFDAFAAAGYRALYWDYQDGGFEWDVTMSGPMIGAGIRF